MSDKKETASSSEDERNEEAERGPVEFVPYTNDLMYKDIKNMYEEVTTTTNKLTRKLLDEAAVAWEESDRLGIPDEKADPCVNHFIAKYPLLAANCPYIFKVNILKERHIDLQIVANALALERAMNETKNIDKHTAEVTFGKLLAKKYFPEDVYNEVEQQMRDPEKVAQMRADAELATRNAEENGPKTVKVKGPRNESKKQ